MKVILLRLFFAGFIGWYVFEDVAETVKEHKKKKMFSPYHLEGLIVVLPLFFLTYIVISVLGGEVIESARGMISMCFGVFLNIGVYYAILWFKISDFRKEMKARTCAILWSLPCFLVIGEEIELSNPRFVIYAPGIVVWVLFTVWLIGFVTIMIKKIAEHISFRRNVLRDSYQVSDPKILTVWENLLLEWNIKKPRFKLVYSPNVARPLSVGIYRRKIRIILPEQDYTEEELELILRHELVHVARRDSSLKFFFVFYLAMCWFNPLVWKGMKECAADIELSCDEEVLVNADENRRKKYGTLLLDVAGDERGFTTCLSASADTLRYRLQNIMRPVKRKDGAVFAGMVAAVLYLTLNYVSLAYDNRSVAELVYEYEGTYESQMFVPGENKYPVRYEIKNEKAFHEYISELTAWELTGNYSFESSENMFVYEMKNSKEHIQITLYDNAIEVIDRNKFFGEKCYYVKEMDWDYINELVRVTEF